jgi:hypothetical protein
MSADREPGGGERRAQELICLLLEGRAGLLEQDELAAAARRDPALRRQLRQQLVVDEMLSQAAAPERSLPAFLDGLQERERIHGSPDIFLAEFRIAMARQMSPPRLVRTVSLQLAAVAVAACIAIGFSALLLDWMAGKASALEPFVARASELAGTLSSTPTGARRAYLDASVIR